ncbi:unnamed protein product [Heligmosomoides polygyrus]|uniref:Rx_N domain-containing protein n=1 Tax=Heligmosomoides polygyrus TaxID=6339 RepID=A0A183G706_HELPZ|nr:unnamed protein product [Heligmosomoides polygyrus]
MASVLSTSQGLPTRAGNRLKTILEESVDLLSVELDSSSSSDEHEQRFKDLRRRIRRATTVIEAEVGKLEDALYIGSRDHSEAAQALVDRAHEALSTLMKLQADIECSTDSREADVLDRKLAPVPMPKFKGDIWEWDTL